MDSDTAVLRLREELKRELHRNFGRIREIETGLSRSEGYLSKFCRGDISIPLDILFKSLELLDTDAGQFFSKALGSRRSSSEHLFDLVVVPDRTLGRMMKVAASLGESQLPPSVPEMVDAAPQKTAKLLSSFNDSSRTEQRRRLRVANKYRDRPFVCSLLQQLDQARYEQPKDVRKLAAILVTETIEQMAAEPIVRLDLQLRAIAIYASCGRALGKFGQAASAICFAVELSRRANLEQHTADLLHRGAYVLGDHGRYQQALDLLAEALVLYYDFDQQTEIAKLQVTRGLMFQHLGDSLSAARALRKALRRLPETQSELRRFRLAAFQGLAKAYGTAGDLDRSERWLSRAIDAFEQEGGLNWAKLVWSRGSLARSRGDLAMAEKCLRSAQNSLLALEVPEAALVSLELTRVLLDRGNPSEAVQMATRMAPLLKSFRNNKVAEAALLGLIRAAIEGNLTIALIDRVEGKLKTASAA